jgi:hypothetical protein
MASLAPSDPHRTASLVGFATTAIGTALLVAPDAVGGRAWIEDLLEARILGGVDVVIAAGLLLGEPRSTWMAARAVATVGTAAFFARIARDGAPGVGTAGPAVLAGALLAVSVVDVGVVRALRREEQAPDADVVAVPG